METVYKKQNDEWLEKVKSKHEIGIRDLVRFASELRRQLNSVFIVQFSRFTSGVPETLRPLITHHVADRYKAKEPIKHVVYLMKFKTGKKRNLIDLLVIHSR